MARKKKQEQQWTEGANPAPVEIESSAARTKRKAAAIDEDLTKSNSGAILDVAQIDCPKCKGHGQVIDRSDLTNPQEVQCSACNGTGEVTEEQKTKIQEDIMASKKTAKAAKAAKKSSGSKKTGNPAVKTAAPIGRERKLLLRLSVEEYDALQAKAAKQGTSMANLLRTSAIG